MFKCDYLFQGTCQLYSKACSPQCNLYERCSGCKYKMIPPGEKPCITCKATGRRKNVV